MIDFATLFGMVISLIAPAPQGMPKEFQLKAGDKVVAIGDSITQGGHHPAGYLRDIDDALAQQYPDLHLPPVINKGISGQKAEDLVKRFQKDVVDQKPAVVTLSIGINDVWHRLKNPHDPMILSAYKENVSRMVDMAQSAGIKVILLTPTVITEDVNAEGNERLKMYVAAEKEIATEKKCILVDLHQMFRDALAKKPKDVKGNWLTADGVHMRPIGDAIMATGVLRGLGVADEKIAATKITTAPPPKQAAK